jgi:hypothetical protein
MKRDMFEWYIQINKHTHTHTHDIHVIPITSAMSHCHLYLDGNTTFHHVCFKVNMESKLAICR